MGQPLYRPASSHDAPSAVPTSSRRYGCACQPLLMGRRAPAGRFPRDICTLFLPHIFCLVFVPAEGGRDGYGRRVSASSPNQPHRLSASIPVCPLFRTRLFLCVCDCEGWAFKMTSLLFITRKEPDKSCFLATHRLIHPARVEISGSVSHTSFPF